MRDADWVHWYDSQEETEKRLMALSAIDRLLETELIFFGVEYGLEMGLYWKDRRDRL